LGSGLAIEQRCGLSTGPGLYVEIGFGESPAALHGTIPFSGTYLGVEAVNGHAYPSAVDEKYASVVLRALPEIGRRTRARHIRKRIGLVCGDANGEHGGLPLGSDCAAEVYMANVLSSPLPAGDRERANILREVMRVLKPGGSLVLKASWADDARAGWRQKRLKRIVKGAGFRIACACAWGEPAYRQLEMRYGQTPQKYVDFARFDDPHAPYVAYFIVAWKPPQLR
jgi:SAM-dependent methyltransferase